MAATRPGAGLLIVDSVLLSPRSALSCFEICVKRMDICFSSGIVAERHRTISGSFPTPETENDCPNQDADGQSRQNREGVWPNGWP